MIAPVLPLYERANIKFTHGKGPYLFSKRGEKYLDFAAGYAAMAFGHCHPQLVKVLTEQSKKLWHVSNRYVIPGLDKLSMRLVEISFADTVFIANSGAEAVECMIKVARRFFNEKGQPNRYHVITIDGAFHGRTLAAASAGSKEKIHGFEPAVQGFHRVRWNDIAALKEAITKNTAAVLIEPIQGEGGMRAHSSAYMKELREICNEKSILLMFDEVQCGMGRTGRMFAYEQYGIKPDVMALGKGLGSGLPVSACLMTEEVGRAMKMNSHGSTYGGNPLAMAVSNKVLDLMLKEDFLPRVNKVAGYLHKGLITLQKQYPDVIAEISGMGLMLGIKLHDSYKVYDYIKLCRKNYVLTVAAAQNVARITPPLIINEKHCDEGIDKMHKALKALIA